MGLFSLLFRPSTTRDEDEVPLLRMTDAHTLAEEDTQDDAGKRASDRDSLDSQGVAKSPKAGVNVRVNDLASLVPEGSIAGGRSFHDLSLYEKKSALINYELECVFIALGIE